MNKKVEENFSGKHIIKMNTKEIFELRSIAKDKGLCGFYKLKKADLLALLLEESSKEMPTPSPKSKCKEGRRALPVKIIPSPQEMDEFEKEEMKKSRPVVKNRLNEWYGWLIMYQNQLKTPSAKPFQGRKIVYWDCMEVPKKH